jgi:hypothetical protein
LAVSERTPTFTNIIAPKITNHYDLMVVIKARFFLVVRLFVGVRTLTANLRVRIFGKLDI